jgi:hypothetical protein
MGTTSATRRFFRLVQAALPVVLAWAMAQPAAFGADDAPFVRVRSSDPAIAAVIDLAAARSATFRTLLTSIQTSNGMVYVEPGECGHGTRACLKIWMRATGATRFLRVMVNPRRADSPADFIGSIGHELQHSVEALSEQGTVDSLGLYNFFSRTALWRDDRFETDAAIKIGNAVRRELRDLTERH